jgi:hypothetical protein
MGHVKPLSVLFAVTIAGLSITSAQPETTNVSHSVAELRQIALEQIDADTNFLGGIRFSVDRGEKKVFRDLSPLPLEAVLVRGDALAGPFESLIRSLVLQRDLQRSDQPDGAVSQAVMKLEQISILSISNLLSVTESTQRLAEAANFVKRIQLPWNDVDDTIQSFAKRIGYSLVGEKGGGGTYQVRVTIDPESTRLRYMPYLSYLKCDKLGLPLDSEFLDLFPGKHKMIGRYFYRAEWPTDLGGPTTGNFLVLEDMTLPFRRPKK